MKRANRVTVQTIENGYKATFYRTHSVIAVVESGDTDWQANTDVNATTNRESFREYICKNAGSHDVEWSPAKATQAWDRKHNTYMTDEQVAEDTITLITPALDRLAEKCKYDMEIAGLEVTAGHTMDMVYMVNMKSGQICKPKTTIADWNELVGKELELNGITIEQESDSKTA